jgi:unsaturated rhamnogalacturonyl hydrolase
MRGPGGVVGKQRLSFPVPNGYLPCMRTYVRQRHIPIFAALVVGLSGTATPAQQQQQQQPSTAPSSLQQPLPQYPVPYLPPTVEQVTEALHRIRQRLEEQAMPRLVEKGKDATDLDKPRPGISLSRGPEGKFPPISYPMGVVNSGLLAAAEATGDARFTNLPAAHYRFFHEHYKTFEAWPQDRTNPFRHFYAPPHLDGTGAMTAAMAKAKRMGIAPSLDPIIEIGATYVHTKQQRLEDGTFSRPGPYPDSLWLDDAYMSVPLLANYGALTGRREYFDDGARQIKGFFKHLWVPEKQLFTHAGHMGNATNHPFYAWGRANGWFMVATVELLELMPKDHPDRDEVIRILQAQAKGIASYQSGTGLWHQLLDRPDSYLETSCTAMFGYAMAKGVNHGWLDPSAYGPPAINAWNGLSTKLSADGRVNDVCIGTNYANDYAYYYHRPATDDIHGYGPVLLCGSEIIKLLKNPNLRITAREDRPVMVVERKDESGS